MIPKCLALALALAALCAPSLNVNAARNDQAVQQGAGPYELVIVEVEGSDPEIDAQLARIKQIAMQHAPVAYRESGSEEESRKIWLGRKSAFGAMGQIADYMCLDGTIPVSELPFVLRRIAEMSAAVGLSVANVFHAGDGNLHPLILFNGREPGAVERAEALAGKILKMCVAMGGSLTGEHGIGVEKSAYLPDMFSAEEIDCMKRLRAAFDPLGIANPGKMFPGTEAPALMQHGLHPLEKAGVISRE